MAVVGKPVSAVTLEPVTTFTVGPEHWKPRGTPAAGDLTVLCVIRPQTLVAGPSGWTALEDGHTFWRIYTPGDPLPTFYSQGVTEWEIRGWVVAAGSYSIPFGFGERSDGTILSY